MDLNIPNEFTVSAVLYKSQKNGIFYRHFGITVASVAIYGDNPKDIRILKLGVISGVNLDNRKDKDCADYWGFWDYETKSLIIIYPSFIQFQVCFPYGPKAAEKAKQGKCLNLDVIEILE